MYKKINGYLTIEASYIIPIVIFLYLLIITATLHLYNRCVISQNLYLIGMRVSRFSEGADNYGEVIYGETNMMHWQPEAYANNRLAEKRVYYPLFKLISEGCLISETHIHIFSEGNGTGTKIQKDINRMNPVKTIREERR